MSGGMIGMVAAGGRKLAAQIAISVVAATCAAIAVPPLLSAIGQGAKAPATTALLPHVAPPVDFDAAFVWPVATPPGVPRDLVRPAVPTPEATPVASRAPVRTARGSQPAARPCGARCATSRPAAAQAVTPPGEPLQLSSMIAPAAVAAPARTVLGVTLPRLPYEDRVVGTLVRARDAVRSLF
ncbi:hypothetical protein ACJ4V0_00670 [Phreatobacter sp. HK31-P]